jgi:predicted DCC family thiol-disulfide oxidoreductase YuxK
MTEPGYFALFYDDGCGPCTFWARLSRGFGRGRIRIYSLDSPEAEGTLKSLPETDRYGSFHLSSPEHTWSGIGALPSLVGLVAGATAERVVERVSFLRRALDRTYASFWEYRRTRGCAVEPPPAG